MSRVHRRTGSRAPEQQEICRWQQCFTFCAHPGGLWGGPDPGRRVCSTTAHPRLQHCNFSHKSLFGGRLQPSTGGTAGICGGGICTPLYVQAQNPKGKNECYIKQLICFVYLEKWLWTAKISSKFIEGLMTSHFNSTCRACGALSTL